MQMFQFDTKLKNLLRLGIFLGVLTFFAGYFIDRERSWFSFLVSSQFVLFLSLGACFFLAVQYVSRAVWSVNIRRLMLGFGQYLPYAFVFSLALLLSEDHLYAWFDPQSVEKDHLLEHKSPYLNTSFFFIRLLCFFSLWMILFKKIKTNSLLQDKQQGDLFTEKNIKLSIAFLLVFVFSFTFYSIDVLMSLEPHWFSTIFGVYTFTGAFQSFIAALCLTIIFLWNRGYLKDAVNINHLHDLGKFLLGCTILWAYIAFSQYMLTWYANLPEETLYYIPRSKNEWAWVSIMLIVGKFALPFLLLLPRHMKRKTQTMAGISVLVLVMQYVDIYWMAYPHFDKKEVYFGFIEVGILLGFVSLLCYVILDFYSKHPLTPLGDPDSKQSLKHKVTY